MKVYIKKGNLNFKERRMVKALESAISKKMSEQANFGFNPATNFSELEALWTEHCTEEVDFTEVKAQNNNQTSTMEGTEPQNEETSNIEGNNIETGTEAEETTSGSSNVDPFNRDEPIVRDYVKGSDFPGDKAKTTTQSIFGEPQTRFDQMQMPDLDNPDQTQGGPKVQGQAQQQPKSEPKSSASNPVNPKFNEMSDNQKKKQTQKMARSIVRLVCAVYEKGIVWWGTKEITDAKLQELQVSGELDLSLLLELSEGQEMEVRDFFEKQRGQIENLAVISNEEKEILIESLTDVMLEKGIGPTPMQVLMLNIAEVFGVRTLMAYSIQKQTGDLITQLKEITANQRKLQRQQDYQTQPETNNEPEPEVNNENTETGLVTT